MRNLFLLTAAGAALAWGAQAQAPKTTPDPSPPASPSADPPASSATGAGANTAAAAADLAAVLSVKDSSGAQIGQIADLKADASGKRVATIKMGASTFAVDADRLAVENGSATINATQSQLQSMLKKK